LDVELDEIDSEGDAGADGGEGVFRGVARGSTVSDAKNSPAIVHGYEFLRMVTGLLPKCMQNIFLRESAYSLPPCTIQLAAGTKFAGPPNGCGPVCSC